MTSKAVVLLSGGMDSATALALAMTEHSAVHCVSFLYGSTHASAELEAAKALVAYYAEQGDYITHQVVQMPDIFGGSGASALMGEVAMPHLTYAEIAEGEGPSPTVVPFRNANLLSAAATIAVTQDAQFVYAGMHAEDARGWAYPDCSPEFLGAMMNAIFIGSYQKVRLVTPFTWSMKSDIVALGEALDVPWNLTWSCYDPQPNPRTYQQDTMLGYMHHPMNVVHCGKCPTCIERLQAFQENNVRDPVAYA